MKNIIIATILVIGAMIALTFLIKSSNKSETSEKIMIVSAHTALCSGAAPQRCMRVKYSPEEDWQYFYSQIEGYEHKEGTESTIEITVQEVENPPADASSLQYTLVQILEETQVPYMYIESPSDFESVSVGNPTIISGMGRGLFENNVVVEVTVNDEIVAQEITTMKTEEVGGEGNWSVELAVDVSESTNGTISAYSPSPKDGNRDIFYSIPVVLSIK